ncbi:MAG: hypothetical protein CMG47_02455 [Candidatus Marinimicrobia bacterium]|nr:hypothetical protein [Candidatus Neomarinimicrobiota bacterium]
MIRIIYIITLLTFIFIGCEDLFKNDTVYGCLDEDACNYSSIANTSDSDLCDYPMENFNCDEECVVEVDACGVCGGAGLDDDQDGVCDDIDPCLGEYSSDDSYFCDNVHVLFDFINSNPSLDSLDIFDIGITDWSEDGRLTYLSLSDLDLISVPLSIENLTSLETLFLNDNKLNSLPETLCNLPGSCQIYVQNNNLCSEYESEGWGCIDQFPPQDCQE